MLTHSVLACLTTLNLQMNQAVVSIQGVDVQLCGVNFLEFLVHTISQVISSYDHVVSAVLIHLIFLIFGTHNFLSLKASCCTSIKERNKAQKKGGNASKHLCADEQLKLLESYICFHCANELFRIIRRIT